jgi:hypothetical protein
MKVKTLGLLFILAFLLNLVWENLHSYLYIHYQGAKITEIILIRAAVFDAFVISVLALGVILTPHIRGKLWFAVVLGILFAISLERFALETNRWAYTSAMPIIPFINTGLTPTIQLALTFLITYNIVEKKRHEPTG